MKIHQERKTRRGECISRKGVKKGGREGRSSEEKYRD